MKKTSSYSVSAELSMTPE